MSATTMTIEEQLEWSKNGNKIPDVDGGMEDKEKCKFCGKREQYSADGRCIICNYRNMLGVV